MTIFGAMNSMVDNFKIISWLPLLPKSWSMPLLTISLVLIAFGAILLSLVNYKYESKCKKCGKFYALQESEEPKVREVKTHGGIRQTITYTYKCKNCRNIEVKKSHHFIEELQEDREEDDD